MDEESALLRARLEALETVVLFLAQQEPKVGTAVRAILTDAHQRAIQIANEPEVARFPNRIEMTPRPTRDKLTEQARVKAYDSLLRKLG